MYDSIKEARTIIFPDIQLQKSIFSGGLRNCDCCCKKNCACSPLEKPIYKLYHLPRRENDVKIKTRRLIPSKLLYVLYAFGWLLRERHVAWVWLQRGTLHNGTLHNSILHNGTLQNGTSHNGTLHSGALQNGT
jgi:hypothetical protein